MSEIDDGFAIARSFLDRLQEQYASGESSFEETRKTLIGVVGALASHGRPVRSSKKPPRGLGYSLDEALVVASLPWFKDNMSAAIRAQYPKATPEEVANHADRIRQRRREIEDTIGNDHPWENSGNGWGI
jgi:hypothetical protein